MSDANLIESLIQVTYDSGYYSGKREDGSPQHLEAIKERGRLRDVTLQRLANLRTALEGAVALLRMWEAHLEVSDPTLERDRVIKAVKQARAALAGAGE